MDKSIPCSIEQKDMVKLLKSMIKALKSSKNSICFERFADKFDRFFNLTSDSILGEEVTFITQLMLILFEKLCDDYQLYEYYFLKCVEYCGLPLKIERINDILPYGDDIRDCLSACAYMLGSTQNVIVTRKLLQLFIVGAGRRKYGFKTNFFTDCLVASKFAEIVSELLHITEFHLYFEYLSALQNILVTDLECREFIKYNVVDVISRRMMYNLRTGLQCTDQDLKSFPLPIHLDLSLRILWLLLRAYLNSSPAYRESVLLKISPETWRIVRNVLLILWYQHERKKRNTFALLFRIIWDQNPFNVLTKNESEIINLGFITEVPCKDPNSWLSDVQFIPDSLDFEFKIFVQSMLYAKRKIPYSGGAVRSMNAIPSLLIILDTTEKIIWTPAQRKKLMLYALLGLHNILPVVVTEFLLYKGPERLSKVIEQILSSALPIHLLFPTLSCINKSLSIPDYDNSEMIKRYVDSNAKSLLANLFQIYLQKPLLSKLCQYSLSVIFCIVGKLADETCDNCGEDINACLILLKKYVQLKASSEFLRPQLLIAIMTHLWDCLLCECCAWDHFISCGGIYIILDAVEQFPLAIKLIGLSMLCDFCGKSAALACLLTWRGKDGCTIVPFLLKLYRQQTMFDQQRSNLKPYIKENSDMEKSNQTINFKRANTIYSSAVLLEMLGSCKPKICALLHILACSPQVNITNESYLISPTDFSYVDEVTAVVAEHYFNLKFAEAWADVKDYFRTVESNPLVFDKALIEYHVKQHKRLLERIFMQQRNYQVQDKVKEIKLEHALYKRIQEQRLSESLDALQEIKTIAVSLNNQFKVQEYNRIVEQLGAKNVKYDFNFHKTLPKAVRVNIFSNKIGICSDIVINPNPGEPLREVSPSNSLELNIVEPLKSSDVSSGRGAWECLRYEVDSEVNIEAIVDDN